MKILMTGSRGFIGQHLAVFCEQKGDSVIHVDLQDGYDLSHPGWSKQLPDMAVDCVVHLAQSPHYRNFPDRVANIFQVNTASMLELVEWARQHTVQRFLFSSTGTVYQGDSGRIKESAPVLPLNIYAASKLSAEYLLFPYSQYFKVVIPRLFGIYGPNQGKMLIFDMIQRVKTGMEIKLAGGVGIYLTPMFIRDCIQVLYTLMTVPLDNRLTLINVAGDEVLSLAEIVDEIARQTGQTPLVKVTDEAPKWMCADNTLLKSLYPQPFMPFNVGIAEVLKAAVLKTSNSKGVRA